MEELERKKMFLKALKEALASMKLEIDFENIELTDEMINDIENKVIKLGGFNK